MCVCVCVGPHYLCVHQSGVDQALVDEDVNQGGGAQRRHAAVVHPHHQPVESPVASLQRLRQGDDPAGVANLKQPVGVPAHQGVAEVCVGSGV